MHGGLISLLYSVVTYLYFFSVAIAVPSGPSQDLCVDKNFTVADICEGSSGAGKSSGLLDNRYVFLNVDAWL